MKTLLWILSHILFALLVIPGMALGFLVAPFLHGFGTGRLAYLAMLVATKIARVVTMDELEKDATDEDERK